MFTVLNAVALRPLDGAHAERLVRLSRATGFTFTYPEYREYRSRARLLDAELSSQTFWTSAREFSPSRFFGEHDR